MQVYCANTAAGSATKHPDYALLGGRLWVGLIHKETPKSFVEYAVANGTGEYDSMSLSLVALLVK